MARSDGWHALGAVPPADLTEARLQAHHAAQWVTRAARAALPAKPDDSHSNLGWDRTEGALMSHDLGGGVRVGLRIGDLTLLRIGPGDARSELPLQGRTNDGAAAWLANQMTDSGLQVDALQDPLPYEIPDHSLDQGAGYEAGTNAAALSELSRWFANADAALNAVVDDHRSVSPGPSPVRCWPHHFDIATLISLEEGDFETARAVGVGLSPGDETYAEPYFYVNPWPHLDAKDLPDLPAPGHWHTDGFVGAIVTGSALVAQAEQQAQLTTFLRAAVAIGRQKLGL